jgi:hypothetical protein
MTVEAEAAWAGYRTCTAPYVDHALIEAAYADPQLRTLFPFHSHRTLNFSRCTDFPYTHDIPVITPLASGRYRVTWWQTRSAHIPAHIGETRDPHEAVAMVVARLPAGCGPAIVGTADDVESAERGWLEQS